MKLTVSTSKPLKREMRLRIPGWCKQYALTVNGEQAQAPIEKGYAVLNRTWKDGDVINLAMEMPVEVVAADPRVKADEGKRAIQRGPLVYCMEEVDNPKAQYDGAKLAANTTFKTAFDANLLDGVETIDATTDGQTIRLIPYYAWDNREAGRMQVWIDYNESYKLNN